MLLSLDPSRAARLLLVATKMARPRALEFNPDQPRDADGKWGSGGRGSDSFEERAKADEEYRSQQRLEKVQRRTNSMAEQMEFDASRIDVVDKEPRPFQVGDLNFREAGHFNPSTGRIEVNARLVGGAVITDTTGLVAHEIAHAQYQEVMNIQRREHDEMNNMSKEDFTKYFKISGGIREQHLAEMEARFPASALYGRTWGDGYFSADSRPQSEKMQKDDGVSEYSRAYWSKEALSEGIWARERALNETLAEVRRIQETGVEQFGDTKPSKEWSELAKGIGEIYRQQRGTKAK